MSNCGEGVEEHYNEYSEIYQCEVNAHILVSFMEMCSMRDPNSRFEFTRMEKLYTVLPTHMFPVYSHFIL